MLRIDLVDGMARRCFRLGGIFSTLIRAFTLNVDQSFTIETIDTRFGTLTCEMWPFAIKPIDIPLNDPAARKAAWLGPKNVS